MTTAPIVQKVWNFCTTLRDDGVGYGDYLEQLTYMIFLKMADEYARPPYSRDVGVPAGCRWADTSNIFAILGLRALYLALAAVLHRFAYLKQALAVLLIFIGSKIFVADLFGWEKFPASWSLGVTFAILAAGVGWSLWRTRALAPTVAAAER